MIWKNKLLGNTQWNVDSFNLNDSNKLHFLWLETKAENKIFNIFNIIIFVVMHSLSIISMAAASLYSLRNLFGHVKCFIKLCI